MALITEDGNGLPDAESFCSVDYADAYHLARGHDAWSDLSVPDKEIALRKATDYMTGEYAGRWSGYRKTAEQSLDWPRHSVRISGLIPDQYVPDFIVPLEVKNACASLALRASASDLVVDEEREIIREKIDVIETEYSPHGSQQRRYTEVENMIRKYFLSGGAGGVLQMIRI